MLVNFCYPEKQCSTILEENKNKRKSYKNHPNKIQTRVNLPMCMPTYSIAIDFTIIFPLFSLTKKFYFLPYPPRRWKVLTKPNYPRRLDLSTFVSSHRSSTMMERAGMHKLVPRDPIYIPI